MSSFNEADYNSWRFKRDAVHYNGGKEFFGYGHRCETQPRLLVIDKYFKKDRSAQRSYLVDGKQPFTTLAEALAALDKPPMLSDEELTLLRGLPDGWSYPEKRGDLLPLADMGMIEWRRDEKGVACQRTGAGRVAALYTEEACPGHVAWALDPKVCGRCGVHIDSFRPDDDDAIADGYMADGSWKP